MGGNVIGDRSAYLGRNFQPRRGFQWKASKIHVFFAGMAMLGSIAAPLQASEQTGTVTQVSSAPGNGASGFGLAGTRTTKPSCATDNLWMIPTPAGDGSKATFAQVLSALMSGKTVQVVGTGACSTVSSREDVAYINSFP